LWAPSAGDDTVLIIAPDNKSAKKLQTRLEDMRGPDAAKQSSPRLLAQPAMAGF